MPQWNPNGPRRWPNQQPYAHKCSECDGWFDAVRPDAVLCSNRCAVRAHRRRKREAAERESVTA